MKTTMLKVDYHQGGIPIRHFQYLRASQLGSGKQLAIASYPIHKQLNPFSKIRR